MRQRQRPDVGKACVLWQAQREAIVLASQQDIGTSPDTAAVEVDVPPGDEARVGGHVGERIGDRPPAPSRMMVVEDFRLHASTAAASSSSKRTTSGVTGAGWTSLAVRGASSSCSSCRG